MGKGDHAKDPEVHSKANYLRRTIFSGFNKVASALGRDTTDNSSTSRNKDGPDGGGVGSGIRGAGSARNESAAALRNGSEEESRQKKERDKILKILPDSPSGDSFAVLKELLLDTLLTTCEAGKVVHRARHLFDRKVPQFEP